MDNIQKYVEYFNNIVERSDPGIAQNHNDGMVSNIETAFWSRKDYDDGSFLIDQIIPGAINKKIMFGPLSTTLNDLLHQGFILRIDGWKNSRNQKLKIVRGKEQYKLAKIPTDQLGRYADLTQWVKDASKPHYEPYTVVHEPKTIIKEVLVEHDPFEQLMLRYPVKKKPIEFVGNQTLKEYVKTQLKEQRRLQNVG